MTKVKLFYSYSHVNESDRECLEKYLANLRNQKLIQEWHDRKIDAGNDWDDEITQNLLSSNVIILLFSQDFIASESCQKEVEMAMEQRKEKGTTVIPIILKPCSWQDVDGIAKVQALPKDAKPISTFDNVDEAWLGVYDSIKNKIADIQNTIKPELLAGFKSDLLHNPIENCTLDKLFVFPDLLKANTDIRQKIENNETDSVKLKNIDKLQDNYIVIEGDEQSGKSSLCNSLFLHYVDTGLCPIRLKGSDVSGKAEIEKIIEKQFSLQYESTVNYFSLPKEKRILMVDDAEEWKTNDSNFAKFLASIPELFEYSLVFIDKVSNLSNQSAEQDHYAFFQKYSIKQLGHKKRNELIKKCIAHDEQIEFDDSNNEQLARLDKDTAHINAIIGSNVVPSTPLFLITIFHTVETTTLQDLSQTSYGHCYHAMITMNLGRTGVKAEDIDSFFNFLTELAYFMFTQKTKSFSKSELDNFTEKYAQMYVCKKGIIDVLLAANIIKAKSNSYSFQYIYIYYYFVAKYISQKMDSQAVKEQVDILMSDIHMKDNANIIIFVTHHTNDKALLEDIILSAMSTFDDYSEATLSGNEKGFIKTISDNLAPNQLPDETHSHVETRQKVLEDNDKLSPITERIEEEQEKNDHPINIEIRKSAKSMEIIGQILKNQYGSLTRPQLEELFEEGQNVGLRLLKSFIDLMVSDRDGLKEVILTKLEKISKDKGKELSQDEKEKATEKLIAQFSYSVLFGWLYKISDSLGYDKLIDIADKINDKTDTVASKLLNLAIHSWHGKQLDFETIKKLHRQFQLDNNHQAVYLLKDVVSRHIYMHQTDYKEKQKIDSLLGFSVQQQEFVQRKQVNS